MDIYSLSSKSSTNSSSNSSSSDDDDFDKLSTNSASSDDTSSLKEEMKFYSEKIAALENKVEENNAILIRIDTKLDKLLNFNNPKEKENKNILNEMPPAYQIDHQEDLAINWRKNDEEEKENKNILHEISPATQIDDDKEAPINCFSALNWPERSSNCIFSSLIARSLQEKSIINKIHELLPARQLDNYEKLSPSFSANFFGPFPNFQEKSSIIKIINLNTNKWLNILNDWGCCKNNCPNICQRGFCQKGNGIVRIRENIAKYYLSTVKNGMNRSIKIIAEKGFVPIKENNCLYYFEVKIIPEIEEKCGWSAEIGLFKNNSQQFRVCSNGLFCSKTNLNSPYKQSQMFGCLIKSNDIIGCGIYFPKLNNENKESLNAQLFFTINGEKKGKTIFLDLNDSENSFQYFPSASLFCCSVEANFGTNKFLYKIDEYKNE